MTPYVWIAAAAVLLWLTPAGLQTTFSSRVDSVRLDVLVTQDGRPLTGLSADDFEVRDNGSLQKVTLLGTGTLPLDVTLALDMSRSLQKTELETLRRAGDLLLRALQPEDHAALLTFHHRVSLSQPLTADRSLVRAALSAAEPSGATSLIDAIFAGLTLSDGAGRRPLLIVFSDGVDTMSWLASSDAIDAAKRFETVVYGVTTSGAARTARVLRDVTAQSGGSVLQVTSRNLEASFVRILDEFRQRYVLSYTLPSAPAPGWHRIDVRVKVRGTAVKARAGYLVGAPAKR